MGCLNKRQDKGEVLTKRHACEEHGSKVRRFWVLVPAESLMSCGMEVSHLTSLVLVSSPRDGDSLIKACITYFPELLKKSNECESCWKI